MKHFFFAFFLALAFAASAQTSFTLNSGSGSQELTIDETGGIYFDGENLTVKPSVGSEPSAAVLLSDMRSIAFSSNNGISTPDASIIAFVLYPNPATDVITIRTSSDKTQETAIYSISGKRVMRLSCKDGDAIDISSLGRGIYVVRHGDTITKFIKR